MPGALQARERPIMSQAIRAGLLYFFAVFAIGFGLGTIRVLLVIPRLVAIAAVLIEVPVLLALAWLICGALLRRCAVPSGLLPRLAMGTTAFGVLMLAELVLAVVLLGQSPMQHWASYRDPAAQIGLAAQMLFAAFPLLRRGVF